MAKVNSVVLLNDKIVVFDSDHCRHEIPLDLTRIEVLDWRTDGEYTKPRYDTFDMYQKEIDASTILKETIVLQLNAEKED